MLTLTTRKIRRGYLWLYNSDAADGGGSSGVSGSDSTAASDVGGTGRNADGSVDSDTSQVHSEEIDLGAARAEAQEGKLDWGTLVPEEFKEKPYIQNLLKSDDPTKQFFTEMDNLQKKLGERPEGVPKDGASQEDWDKFYKSIGRPDTADGYEMPKTEWGDDEKQIGEFVDKFRGDKEFEKDVKQVFYEEGLTKKQAENIAAKYDKLLVRHNKQFFQDAVAATGQLDADYDQMMKEAFGARAAKVEEVGHKIIKANVPENVKPLLAGADPKTLTILAAVLDSINNKYIREDSGTSKTDQVGSVDEKSQRAQAMKLMASDAWRNAEHPQHEQVKKDVKDLYARLYAS